MINNYWNSFDISSFIDDLLENGYAKLPSIRNLNIEFYGNQIISELNDLTFAELLSAHKNFLEYFEIEHYLVPKLYEIAVKKFNFKGSIDDQYHISRKIVPGNDKESFRTHFDSHIFTLVIPLKIPKRDNPDQNIGELFFFPALRNHPKNEISNIFSKIWYKRFASKDGIEKLSRRNLFLEEDFLDYEPLLFLGNTFLHANHNVSIDVKSERLTLLAHYFDPSPKYGIGSFLRYVRNR